MRAILSVAIVLLTAVAATTGARADGGPLWQRTTPRAISVERSGIVLLRVPDERAWGLQSTPVAITPGARYRLATGLAVPDDGDKEAFVRVALYRRADGSGRQRLVVDGDTVLAGESAPSVLSFVAPSWARAAKLRVLVRRLSDAGVAELPVRLALPRLLPDPPWPAVVLREVD